MGSDGSCIINNGSFDRPVRPDQVLVCFLFVVESEYTLFGFDFVPILTQNGLLRAENFGAQCVHRLTRSRPDLDIVIWTFWEIFQKTTLKVNFKKTFHITWKNKKPIAFAFTIYSNIEHSIFEFEIVSNLSIEIIFAHSDWLEPTKTLARNARSCSARLKIRFSHYTLS